MKAALLLLLFFAAVVANFEELDSDEALNQEYESFMRDLDDFEPSAIINDLSVGKDEMGDPSQEFADDLKADKEKEKEGAAEVTEDTATANPGFKEQLGKFAEMANKMGADGILGKMFGGKLGEIAQKLGGAASKIGEKLNEVASGVGDKLKGLMGRAQEKLNGVLGGKSGGKSGGESGDAPAADAPAADAPADEAPAADAPADEAPASEETPSELQVKNLKQRVAGFGSRFSLLAGKLADKLGALTVNMDGPAKTWSDRIQSIAEDIRHTAGALQDHNEEHHTDYESSPNSDVEEADTVTADDEEQAPTDEANDAAAPEDYLEEEGTSSLSLEKQQPNRPGINANELGEFIREVVRIVKKLEKQKAELTAKDKKLKDKAFTLEKGVADVKKVVARLTDKMKKEQEKAQRAAKDGFKTRKAFLKKQVEKTEKALKWAKALHAKVAKLGKSEPGAATYEIELADIKQTMADHAEYAQELTGLDVVGMLSDLESAREVEEETSDLEVSKKRKLYETKTLHRISKGLMDALQKQIAKAKEQLKSAKADKVSPKESEELKRARKDLSKLRNAAQKARDDQLRLNASHIIKRIDAKLKQLRSVEKTAIQ